MGEGEVVKKMGAWTTGKGPKGGRIGGWEEERSKQRGRPRVCGEDDALAGCRASDERERERERERDYKRKGWWRMYCCVVRMCISIYPPGGPRRSVLTLPLASPSQHGTQRRREHKPRSADSQPDYRYRPVYRTNFPCSKLERQSRTGTRSIGVVACYGGGRCRFIALGPGPAAMVVRVAWIRGHW